jgi:hypothetical protein
MFFAATQRTAPVFSFFNNRVTSSSPCWIGLGNVMAIKALITLIFLTNLIISRVLQDYIPIP